MILGSIDKIKKVDLQTLEELKGEKILEFVDLELISKITPYCQKYKTAIGFTLNKDSCIQEIFVGSDYKALPLDDKDNLQTPQGRLFNIVFAEKTKINPIEQTFLRRKRLECICKISYDEKFNGAEIALLKIDEVKTMSVESVEFINKYGIEQKIEDNLAEFKEFRKKGFDTTDEHERAIIVGVGRRGEDIETGLNELENLANSAGIEVVGRFTQTRKVPDKAYYVGVGKLEEIREEIAQKQANIVIFDDELSGNKIKNLEDELEVKVSDRSNVILDIFAKRASSNEGRLQVNLARMKYNFSRIPAFQNTENKGLGMRGVGETKMELSRRALKNKMFAIENQIKEIKSQRQIRRLRRKDNSEKIVSLVGYTNAGKSTLLNKMTDAQAFAEDMLFATLDTTTRECYLDPNCKVLLTDTVGFIDKLPHEFIDAFSATLEESVESDLLLIVVDISDPEVQRKYDVVIDTLTKIKANEIKSIVLLNKSDAKTTHKLNTNRQTIEISAKSGEGIPQLKKELKRLLF